MSQSDLKASAGLDLNTLLKLIPDFDTLQSAQVYRFIRSCDSAFQLASTSQQIVLLTYALNKITGPGSSDIHSKQFFKWTDLKSFLILKYSQTKTLTHLNLELQSLFQKPRESITEYFHRVDLCRSKIIEKLTAEITDSTLEGRIATTEETAHSVFVNGLSSDIGVMLRVREFKTLSEAGNFAIQEEKVRNMNSSRQMLFNNVTPTGFIKRAPQNPRISPRENVPSENATKPNVKHCNYCKKPGHVITECRKRAYNNNLRQSHPPPVAKVNNLNLEAAEVMGMSSETALAHVSNAQTFATKSDVTPSI